MTIDQGGIDFLYFPKKRLAFEAVIFYGEKVLFINSAFRYHGAALTDFAAFIGDLFLGAYPLPCLVIKYASGGNLYIRLGKQLPFAEDKVDVVIGLFLVMVESRYAFHAVPSAKFLCEFFKHLLRLIGGVNFGQGDNQLPCFNTLSRCAASLKFLLTFPCKITPKGAVCGAVSGVEVLLFYFARNIREMRPLTFGSFDI